MSPPPASRPLDRVLDKAFRDLESTLGPPNRVLVAYSGGLDSTVLLHALAQSQAQTDSRRQALIAVHVDHGLQKDSRKFREHCVLAAEKLGLECIALEVSVDTGAGLGVEAAARTARYEAIVSIMQTGDWVLSAHHADDQAETLLLNLLRGSGPDGLASMPGARRLGPGWLVRPLLGVDRATLESEARSRELEWIEDPSNATVDFDRNYLRHEVLPVLERRWPDVVPRLTRSVERAQDARELLIALGEDDVAGLGSPGRLSVGGLNSLEPSRRRNAIRTAIRLLGLPMPPGSVLESILRDVLLAREDALPLVSWAGGEARRYRDFLYLSTAIGEAPAAPLAVERPVTRLPAGLGALEFDDTAASGLSPAIMARELSIRWREGGETIRLDTAGPTRKLKALLQEAGVVPWLRERMPLIYADGELVAVADLYVAADAAASPGTEVRWLDHPPLA